MRIRTCLRERTRGGLHLSAKVQPAEIKGNKQNKHNRRPEYAPNVSHKLAETSLLYVHHAAPRCRPIGGISNAGDEHRRRVGYVGPTGNLRFDQAIATKLIEQKFVLRRVLGEGGALRHHMLAAG